MEEPIGVYKFTQAIRSLCNEIEQVPELDLKLNRFQSIIQEAEDAIKEGMSWYPMEKRK